jgi:hypothetical protein
MTQTLGEVTMIIDKRHKLFIRAALLMLCCLLLSAQQSTATETGGGHYPNGAEGFMAGAVPPPGTYFINYFNFYSTDSFKDKHGDDMFPFRADIFANTFRLVHITDKKLLGGNWGMHVFLPLVKVDVDKHPAGKDHREGLGDIIVSPMILSWHGKSWHVASALDIHCPTGEYDKNRVANIGRNYWTFEPVFAATYVTDNGYEVSAKFMYDFNTRNDDTNYRSGQEFHVDYTLGRKIGNLSLGVGGYYYRQITEDNAPTPTLDKGMTVAVGPQVKYDYKNMSFVAKYQFEVDSRNRPQGNNLWAKFVYAF